jgi:hypothetical protein
LAFGFADDVHDEAQDALGPLDEATGVAGVGEDEPEPAGGQIRPEQRAFGAIAVLDARGADHHCDQQAHRVGDDEPFSAVDLLPAS